MHFIDRCDTIVFATPRDTMPSHKSNIERQINVSPPIQFQDLNREKGAAVELSDGEKTILGCTTNVEGQE